MSLFSNLFGAKKKSSAEAAVTRLRAALIAVPTNPMANIDYAAMQRDILEVVKKYIKADMQDKVNIERSTERSNEGSYEVLQVSITVPEAS
jgi:cell division topological specificity factor MinE